MPGDRMCFDTKHLLNYWRLSPDRRMVFGGRASLSPTTIADARDVLHAQMVRVHPQLRGVAVTHAWGGNVAVTLDRLPHCGRIDGVAYATGCNGTGVALATWSGERAAAWMTGEEDPPGVRRAPVPADPVPPAAPVVAPARRTGAPGRRPVRPLTRTSGFGVADPRYARVHHAMDRWKGQALTAAANSANAST